MKLDVLFEECNYNVEAYFVRLESLGLEENSLVWQLENLVFDIPAGPSARTIGKQTSYIEGELLKYSLYGIKALRV